MYKISMPCISGRFASFPLIMIAGVVGFDLDTCFMALILRFWRLLGPQVSSSSSESASRSMLLLPDWEEVTVVKLPGVEGELEDSSSSCETAASTLPLLS